MTAREIERRYLTQPVEWRAASGGGDGPGELDGYAAVFNRLSQDLGGFVEVVDPGAFNKSLGDNLRVLCRYNHSDDGLLGTSDAGTLTLSVDSTGLHYVDSLPDTTTGRDVAVLAKRGDLRNSSFAFICLLDEWTVTPSGFPLRRLLQVQLVDVAPVVNPAYLDATTGMRSLAAHLGLDVSIVADKPLAEIRSLLMAGDNNGLIVPTPTEPTSEVAAEPLVEAGSIDGHTPDADPVDNDPDRADSLPESVAPISVRRALMDLEMRR